MSDCLRCNGTGKEPESKDGGWKPGPLPPDTWNWGAVVKAGQDSELGFNFANFVGDHVIIEAGEGKQERLEPYQVGMYNNCIKHPGL